MTARRSNSRSPSRLDRLDIGALIWGLLLTIVSGLGVALALDVHLIWRDLTRMGPLVLICLGTLGIVLTLITKGHRS
ncbi:Uncharacterised protein [Acidipropionibacterium jensenii]|uniref:Uncharacterized protein n=1 Tax=Acidipropionibacterium jensenii TaxID=1749 RepID=A0A3S4UZF3_9ACTN|nr:hypothetical protein [Acidipropionibacterium jensenii]QCV88373.1 hypothetical protein FEZ32_08385 [Acidipropionibacterium jensenii]VEI04174.1 Uncharacterised protein [Acidipropionibacterium jensenii]